MSETKEYIIVFEERRKVYRLIPKTGRVIRVKKDHKKFEWVQQQEPGKVVKINSAGRWTSSKDYNGLYQQIQQENKSNTESIAEIEERIRNEFEQYYNEKTSQYLNEIENVDGKGDPDLPADAKTDNKEKSILGHHDVKLGVSVEMSKYEETNTLRQSEEADELLLDVATFYTTVSFASTQTVQRKFLIGYNRASRIVDALEKLSVIKDHKPLVQSTAEVKQLFGNGNEEIDLGIDPKSSKWPITEKINCSKCSGYVTITSTRIESTGFLKLKKKEVSDETICVSCNGVGSSEKLHYPYHFVPPQDYNYNIEVSYDLDNVVKELLDYYISTNEFTRYDILFFLRRSCDTVYYGAMSEFEKKHSLKSGNPPKAGSVPQNATWEMIEKNSSNLNQFTNFTVKEPHDFIGLLFKLQIIDDGTQRRSTKDTSTYYKFTKQAKKLYKDL
jgi:hypothetical protein